MRLARFQTPTGPVQVVWHQASWRGAKGNLAEGFAPTDEIVPEGPRLVPAEIAQIWCIGLNYRRHAEETGATLPPFPVLFAKGLGALQAPGGPVVLPASMNSSQTDFEVELAVVIGKPARNVRRENALHHVAGYTVGVDVSERGWQKKGGGGQWMRGKTFDTFAPLGPDLITPEELGDAGDLRLCLWRNGALMQDSRTSDMLFGVSELIEFLSRDTTLVTGTVILTGTPEGVGMARRPPVFLKSGDEIHVEIEGIGGFTFPVEPGRAALAPIDPMP